MTEITSSNISPIFSAVAEVSYVQCFSAAESLSNHKIQGQ